MNLEDDFFHRKKTQFEEASEDVSIWQYKLTELSMQIEHIITL